MSPEIADRIVTEAESWLRTPWKHAHDVKGFGIDCAMFLLRVYQGAGLVPAEIDPRPYPRDWYLHRGEERFLGWVTQYAERVEVGERGDVAMYTVGRLRAHGAVLVDETLMIHASRPSMMVEYCERRTWAHCLDSYWRVRC